MKSILRSYEKGTPIKVDRGAITPSQWVPELLVKLPTLPANLQESACALLLMQFLGWRADMVMSIALENVLVYPECIKLFASRQKWAPKSGHPVVEIKFDQLIPLRDLLV